MRFVGLVIRAEEQGEANMREVNDAVFPLDRNTGLK